MSGCAKPCIYYSTPVGVERGVRINNPLPRGAELVCLPRFEKQEVDDIAKMREISYKTKSTPLEQDELGKLQHKLMRQPCPLHVRGTDKLYPTDGLSYGTVVLNHGEMVVKCTSDEVIFTVNRERLAKDESRRFPTPSVVAVTVRSINCEQSDRVFDEVQIEHGSTYYFFSCHAFEDFPDYYINPEKMTDSRMFIGEQLDAFCSEVRADPNTPLRPIEWFTTPSAEVAEARAKRSRVDDGARADIVVVEDEAPVAIKTESPSDTEAEAPAPADVKHEPHLDTEAEWPAPADVKREPPSDTEAEPPAPADVKDEATDAVGSGAHHTFRGA